MRHSPSLIAGLLLFLPAMSSPVPAQTEPTPVYIEDSPDADDLVKQARVLHEQKRLTETAAMYQRVADEYTHKLMQLDGPVYVDGLRWVRLTVAADSPLLEAYRKLHEPIAARTVEQAMLPFPQLTGLEKVAHRFALCDSGLEAALRAAALHLERGAPVDAANLLGEFARHPALQKHQARWHMLQAAAAIYARDAAQAVLHRKALTDLKATATLRELDAIAAQLGEVVDQPAISSLQVLPSVTVPQLLGKPLYVREAQPDPDPQRGPSTDPSRFPARDGDHPMIPTVSGDTVFVNTGQSLRALDRSSLSDMWATPFTSGAVDGTAYDRLGVMNRDQAVRDQRGVLVAGDHVVAVMGRVTATGRGAVLSSTPETTLVCVDRTDGKLRWRRSLEQFDPSFTQSYFHGTPVGGDGRAYVMVRRSQNSGFRDAFLLAVDLHTGSLLWKRHLSSTTPGFTSRGMSHLLADRGRLYVSDNLGAVACLDGRTGTMQWLHRVSKFKMTRGAGSRLNWAWTLSPPVLVKAGLVVSPFMGGTAAMLLHPDTGAKLRDLDDDAFIHAAYLIAAGDDLLSVGQRVSLHDGATLDAKWMHPMGQAGPPAARGVVTQDRVIIPTATKLVHLKLADGTVESESPLEHPGNLIALEGQILITTGTVVRSYMTWPVVYANLTSRIRRNPADAKAGLALAHAAIASGQVNEALEGVDHVVAVMRHRSITRPPDQRPENDQVHADLFQQLLQLSDTVAGDVKLRREIFDRIAKATVTPRDEAQYHLAFANYLVESDWPEEERLDRRRDAARHFQTVLENPILAGQMVPRGGGYQQGGVEARMKLAGMIERFSRAIYDEFDDRAAQELRVLTSDGDADPAALIELTRKYPLARTAGAAMLAAGEALAKAGQPVDAITQLRRAYRERAAAALRPRIVGLLVEQYTRTGKALRARQWLQRAERDKIDPIRAGGPVAARTWLAELGSKPLGDEALPELRDKLAAAPTVLPGTLMLPAVQPREQWPLDRALLRTGDLIQLRGGPGLERIWEARIEADAQLLWFNESLAMFWVESTRSLVALESRSGKLLWPRLKVEALLEELDSKAGGDARRQAQAQVIRRGPIPVNLANDAPLLFQVQPIQPAQFAGAGRLSLHGQPVNGDASFAGQSVRIVINDAIACIADSAGRVIGINLDSGQVQWRFNCPFDQLDQIAISGECVAFAGQLAMADFDNGPGIIVALDALTGDVITQLETGSAPQWLGLSEGDALLYTQRPVDRRLPARLIVHQLPDGELIWSTDLTTGRIDAATLAGESVIFLVDGGDLLVAQPHAKTLHDPLSCVSVERTESVDLAITGDQWQVLTDQQTSALRSDTTLRWRDAIHGDAGKRLMQLVGRRRTIIITYPGEAEQFRLPPPQRLPNPNLDDAFTVQYRIFLLDRQGGSILQEYKLPLRAARFDSRQALLLHHHALLGAGAQTIVISDEAGR